jgi:hypothetical protein
VLAPVIFDVRQIKTMHTPIEFINFIDSNTINEMSIKHEIAALPESQWE